MVEDVAYFSSSVLLERQGDFVIVRDGCVL